MINVFQLMHLLSCLHEIQAFPLGFLNAKKNVNINCKKKNDSASMCKITVSSVNFDLHTPQSFFPVPLYVHTRNFFHANSGVLIHRTLEIITKERIIHIRPYDHRLREILCVIHDNYIKDFSLSVHDRHCLLDSKVISCPD